ncbi:hypothetical protein [Veronia pacifica]|uniref:hypothetical protein n=1 Tax=Veronia pacifica TaxID=1080227 RepID=UPI001C2FC7D1|nr:hypothetical protein [Veronia pacifica]
MFEQALYSSRGYRAIQKELLSNSELSRKENNYYYPKVLITGEIKENYGEPKKDPKTTADIKLTLNSKVYGSQTKNRQDAAGNNVLSSDFTLMSKEIEVYFVVLNFLTKIERTRLYERQAGEIGREIDIHYRQQLKASKEGIGTQSDEVDARLKKSRFSQTVFGITSKIDNYFRDLKSETGFMVDGNTKRAYNKIGLEYKNILPLLERQPTVLSEEVLVEKNFGVLSNIKSLEATKLSSEAGRERFKIMLTNENAVSLLAGSPTSGVKSGDTGNSFLSLKFELDVFDQALERDKRSSLHLFEAEREKLFKRIEEMSAESEALVYRYETLVKKRSSINKQIRLSKDLIIKQKKEIAIDKVKSIDIVDSLISLNQSYISLMNIELEQFDIIYRILEMKSERAF